MQKILIVDNDAHTLALLQDVFNYEGYETIAVGEPEDIVKLVNQHHPDLLLLDYILDGINGGDLCSQVKSNEYTRDLPVILISAYPQVLHSLGSYGYNAFISKPFNLFELTSCVRELMHSSNYPIN